MGEKSGGAGGHDFDQFLSDWTKLLKERGALVEGGRNFPTSRQLDKSDVLILYSGERDSLSASEKSNLEEFVKDGGGLVVLHDGIRTADADFLKGIAGGGWDAGANKSRGGLMGLYFQDRIAIFKNLTANLGIRFDKYSLLTSEQLVSPRINLV